MSILLQELLKMSSLRLHANSKTHVPFVNCTFNDALFDAMQNVQQTLLQLIKAVNQRLVDTLQDDAPDLEFHWVEIVAVLKPLIWGNKHRRSCSISLTMSSALCAGDLYC